MPSRVTAAKTMEQSLGRVWIAVTNHRKFTISADTHDQAVDKFQEKMGYYPEDWQLELMERPTDPISSDVEISH